MITEPTTGREREEDWPHGLATCFRPPPGRADTALSRRAFIQSTGLATLFTMGRPIRSGGAEAEDSEEVLAQARERIQRHRQSPVAIVLSNGDGRPLEGGEVVVEQLQHDFLWGCNAFSWSRPEPAEIMAAYRERFSALFNFATLGFYWDTYEPEQGRPRYAATDAVVDWCRTNDIVCKGHPLVWASIPDPKWLPDDAAGIHAASLRRVREIVRRFRGRIDTWDVVNEPSLLAWANTRFGRWAQAVGTQSFVAQHLREAREANPDATLLVNEVLTDYPSYSVLDRLREDGRLLFDAVGLQSHMHRGVWPLRGLRGVCDRFARLGAPLHFTEFTILSGPGGDEGRWATPTPESEEAQAEHAARHYTLLFGHPAVQALSWWDLSDRGAWKSAPAGLLREDMSPKPAYERLLHLIRKVWWTSIEGRTDADGRFLCRAFHGRHRVTVRCPDGQRLSRDFECGPDRENRLELVCG